MIFLYHIMNGDTTDNPHMEMSEEEYFLLYPESPNSPDEIEMQEQIKERHG